MNNSGHSDMGGLLFLLLLIYVVAALLEGCFVSAFIIAIIKWKSLWWLSIVSGLAMAIFPIIFIKKIKF